MRVGEAWEDVSETYSSDVGREGGICIGNVGAVASDSSSFMQRNQAHGDGIRVTLFARYVDMQHVISRIV